MLETTNYIYPIQPTAPLSREEESNIRRDMYALIKMLSSSFTKDEMRTLYNQCTSTDEASVRGYHCMSTAMVTARTARLFAEQIEPDRNLLITIFLAPAVKNNTVSIEQIRSCWGEDVAFLIDGYVKVREFASRSTDVSQDNFRGLLLSLARDIRIIIVMITESLAMMRLINHHPHTEWVRTVAFEANCLYAQLAHRLGLYKIKGELEDLSLKYTNREIYTNIARRLNETKRQRDAYIASFIAPVKKRLQDAGLRFSIKGRTKSISSIWAKIKKQKVDLDHIYDLFAIRVIIDTPLEREKSDCWLAYSILADMYTANPARMKDWISIPKSNGYESLHATVMGPQNKWVEVQFRTVRMDLVAEKGMAAHWRYKGGHGDSTDQWMNNIRDILESADAGPMQLMRNMKMDAEKEIYAFTPKGDLFRLAPGSTVLDFAFHIHSHIGCRCTGAVVNSKHQKITYRIQNGDTVEILTSSTQTPKQDWLQYVSTTRAKNKIRQALNEAKTRLAELGREQLERRLKNRKLDIEEQVLLKVIKKSGYKYTTDFFADIADEVLDISKIIDMCVPPASPEEGTHVSADEFKIHQETETASDVLVIGDNDIKGLNYKLSRCCAPVYGDNVFGFISADGIVKIHRHDCPNAANIKQKYPYRLISVRWSGVSGHLMPVALRITGADDIGIVTNITSLINKEKSAQLRSISIDSDHGIFHGVITIAVSDKNVLSSIVKKIKTVKGVKEVSRT